MAKDNTMYHGGKFYVSALGFENFTPGHEPHVQDLIRRSRMTQDMFADKTTSNRVVIHLSKMLSTAASTSRLPNLWTKVK